MRLDNGSAARFPMKRQATLTTPSNRSTEMLRPRIVSSAECAQRRSITSGCVRRSTVPAARTGLAARVGVFRCSNDGLIPSDYGRCRRTTCVPRLRPFPAKLKWRRDFPFFSRVAQRNKMTAMSYISADLTTADVRTAVNLLSPSGRTCLNIPPSRCRERADPRANPRRRLNNVARRSETRVSAYG
jgi:hypothetical protein